MVYIFETISFKKHIRDQSIPVIFSFLLFVGMTIIFLFEKVGLLNSEQNVGLRMKRPETVIKIKNISASRKNIDIEINSEFNRKKKNMINHFVDETFIRKNKFYDNILYDSVRNDDNN
jgi:hypothetical protein